MIIVPRSGKCVLDALSGKGAIKASRRSVVSPYKGPFRVAILYKSYTVAILLGVGIGPLAWTLF